MGLDIGYVIVFLTEDEYHEVNANWTEEDAVKRPMSSLTLFKEKYDLPTSVNDFLTLFKQDVNMVGGSQVAIQFNLENAMKVVHNEADAHRHHQKTFGVLWHELGHDLANLQHNNDYDTLPDHGGGSDLSGRTAYACIMCQNNWLFCPKCRAKMRAIEPTATAWISYEEEKDIKDNHLYSAIAHLPDWAIPQIHQPQQEAGNVPRP